MLGLAGEFFVQNFEGYSVLHVCILVRSSVVPICVGVPKVGGLVLSTLVSMKFSIGVCCGTASG